MECPQCKSKSVIIKDGQKRCQAKGCPFIEFHVITYENENRQFEGQKGTQNRFNSINPQINDKQTPNHIKVINRNKVIQNLIARMGLSNDLQDRAQAKFAELMQIKSSDAFKGKITVKEDNLAAYSLWLACYDKKLYFKDVRIANQMGISKLQWQQMHKCIQQNVKALMTIPSYNIELLLRRTCAKRKIDDVEQQAMVKMYRNMMDRALIDGKKTTTFAGFIFWQIMSRSSTYNGNGKQFNLQDYLTKSRKYDDEERWWTQKQIQTSFDAIKKLRAEKFPNINQVLQLIPNFETRKPEINQK